MNLAAALLVAVLIGAILPLQGLVNARLGVHVGGPVAAAVSPVVTRPQVRAATGCWLRACRRW